MSLTFTVVATWIFIDCFQSYIATTVTPPTRSSKLLPFGIGANDTRGPRDDDGASAPLILQVPITFYGIKYRDIIVNSNGVLSFDDQVRQVFASPFENSYEPWIPPLIAPFWDDINPKIGGNIYYRQSNDSSDQLAFQRLLLGLDVGELVWFSPTNLFIATWDQVPQYNGQAEVNNTFQVVIATDTFKTVAVFTYDDIQWGQRSQVGFYAGDEYNYLLLRSHSSRLINMSGLTNVGEPGVFVYRIDNLGIVECSTTHNCAVPDLGNMTNTQCCINNSAGHTYTVPGSDSDCHTCIVFGWLNGSLNAIEQDRYYILKVGYQKGADSAEGHNDLEFTIETNSGVGYVERDLDYTIEPLTITITSRNPELVDVHVKFPIDGVTLESDEELEFNLIPSESTLSIINGIFFLRRMYVNILDSDVLDMFLSNKSYEAAESDEFLQVSICVNKKIGRHNEVPVCITAETVEMANQSGIPLPATILADNPYSPSKAENEDFEVTSPCVTFHGDEQLHNFPHCVGIGIHIIDDDVNEADQVFIIHLRPPNLLNYNVNMFCNVSLGWIKDNDPISIGFEKPSYTFNEPPAKDLFQVILVTEHDRTSEQTFKLEFDLPTLNSTSFYKPVTDTVILHPHAHRLPFELILFSNDSPLKVQTFNLTLISSRDDRFPKYDPPNFLTQVATIVVNDTKIPVGFSEKILRIVEKEDDVARITIFTHTSINGSMVTFMTSGETATEDVDYKGVHHKVVNFEGNDSIIMEIMIYDDDLAEGLEVFVGVLEVNSPFQTYSDKIKIEIIDDEGEGSCIHTIGGQNCSKNALCTVINGRDVMNNCSCKDNFKGNGFICEDVDECRNGLDNCSANSECHNIPGGFNCHCNHGFVRVGTECLNATNEVSANCSEPDENCKCDTSGRCFCNSGFSVSVKDGITLCSDIDECKEMCKYPGICDNTDGSYHCICPPGYVYNDTTKGCTDIDECTFQLHNCSKNAECTNTDRSYMCTCKKDYFGDGMYCYSSTECVQRTKNISRYHNGSKECGCSPGYYFEPKMGRCQNFNECMIPSVCNKNAICKDKEGSFMCKCNSGFQGNGKICNDIDECALGLDDCGENANCNNTEGNFECSCKSLYYKHGNDGSFNCELGIKPEIAKSIIPGRPNHNLTYSIGADFCLENEDSFEDGVTIYCHVANEPYPPPQFTLTVLKRNSNGVRQLLTVSEETHDRSIIFLNQTTLFSLFENDTMLIDVTCTVNNSYGSNNKSTSIRHCGLTECQDGVTNNCSQICKRNSSTGQYSCDCNPGYKLTISMDTCININECANSSMHNCSEEINEICEDNEGSYMCVCKSGFEMDEGVCKDINECGEPSRSNCSENQICLNKPPGSFTCECKPGYHKLSDMESCEDINECSNATQHNCSGTNHMICVNMPGSYKCHCEPGFEENDSICQDVKECDYTPKVCSQKCHEMEGSYYCSCDIGFTPSMLDNSSCSDIDECETRTHECHGNALCNNTNGSYSCICMPPYNGDGFTCHFSETIGTIIGFLLFLLIIGIVLVLASVCYIQFRKTKANFHADPNLALSPGFTVQSSYKLKLPPNLLVPSSTIKLTEPIGQGEFSVVYKGRITHKIGKAVSEVVAVKTLKGFYDSATVKEMLRECSKMYEFDHPNVLNMRGVCLDGGPAPYIIMPFMINGSLLDYLKNNQAGLIIVPHKDVQMDVGEVADACKKLMDMCIQVAKGMEYLASMKIVHRDLAARNCMIDVNFVIKVADFGLSERVSTKEYFRQDKSSTIKLPLKWLAPESIEDYIFSEKSDVWAYGVTCWEIFTAGKVPYPGVDLTELPRLLANGFRLEKPKNDACRDEMYMTMMKCWEFEPVRRPTFYNLVQSVSLQLQAIAEYHDIGATLESLNFNSEVSSPESKVKMNTQLQNESSQSLVQETSVPNSPNLNISNAKTDD